MASLAERGNGATLVEMRRGILCVLLVSGCFAEAPEPIDKIGAPMTTTPADDESGSSSSESPSDASSSEESSSSTEPTGPVCPVWCVGHCDLVQGVYMLCVCSSDLGCHDGTECNREPETQSGYCV